MTGKERILNTIKDITTDKIPNLNILMTFAAKEIKVNYKEYCTNYKNLTKGNIECAQKYGIDCVTVMSDALIEATDLGINAQFPTDDVPYTKEHFTLEQLQKLKPIKPEDGKRMTNRVNAVAEYKRICKDEYAIIGWAEGAFAEMADLRGVNEIMIDMYDEPETVHEILAMCLEQGKLLAKAQIDAGADIIGVGDAICSVAGPVAYKQFGLKYEAELLKYIKECGAYTKLHICGDITPLLHLLPIEYIDILDLDWVVDIKTARETVGEKPVISGNYDPVAILLQGSTQDVNTAVKRCAGYTINYATSAGCEVPKDTPKENLMEVKRAIEEI